VEEIAEVAAEVVAAETAEMVEKERLPLERGVLRGKESSPENFPCEKEFADFAGIR